MKVYELKLKVFVLKDMEIKASRERLCSLIDKSFLKNKKISEIHEDNIYKFYTFNNLYPLEESKVYKEGNIYTLIIRTMDEQLLEHFIKYLSNEHTDYLKSLVLEYRVIQQRHIEKIYNITPAIAKFENGYWKTNQSIEVLEKRIKENLIKKYNELFNVKIKEDFELFTFIKLENSNPIPCKYKNTTLLGDKMTLTIAENSMAQDLAYLAIGSGILEMGSRGMGFVNYKCL